MQEYKKSSGFTLVELLIVTSIIAVLAVTGIVIYTQVSKAAIDARKKTDIGAISKAYEAKYLSLGKYTPLTGSDFASGSVPIPPDGGSYDGMITVTANSFRICAALKGHPTPICNNPSNTCFCRESQMEKYIAPLPTSTPTPTTAISTPTPISTTVNFYAGAGDGYVRSASSTDWNIIHNATDGASAYTSSTSTLIRATSSLSPLHSDGFIYRAFIPIDTSSIPDNATIVSATLNLNFYGVDNTSNNGNNFVSLVQTSQASPNNLSASDYDQAGAIASPVEGSNRLDFSNITINQYTVIPLNMTGLSWINKTGITLLGLREGHDIVNMPPDNEAENGIRAYSSEQPGTSQDPYLTVIYTQ